MNPSPMLLDWFTGFCFIGAGLSLLWRQILLSPHSATFPCAPIVVRVMMFLAGVGTVWIGVLFVDGHRYPYAGDAAIPVAIMAAAILVYHAVMLANIFRERRPARAWASHRRIDKVLGRPAEPAGLRAHRHG